MHERYSIEVNDDFVIICGDITIEEAFDFINFFDKKGFKSLSNGPYESALCLRRLSIDEVDQQVKKMEHENSEKFYEILCDQLKVRVREQEIKISDLDRLIKDLMVEEKSKQLMRQKRMMDLEEDPRVDALIKSLDNMEKALIEDAFLVCDEPGTKIEIKSEFIDPFQHSIQERKNEDSR